MTIQSTLAELLGHIPDAQAASLMGYDGLSVATSSRGAPLPHLETWLTEYAQTLVCLRRAAQEVPSAGAPQDVVIQTDAAQVLLRPLHQDYYLAVVQHAHAPQGRARFYMSVSAQALRAEL
jgi:predicted regulator of Ras-like GTPase activity (Roadblock/LC7/MglB family)